MIYEKIETLFKRDPKTFKVMEDVIRCPEFENIREWWCTEKVDGMNIRVTFKTLFERGKPLTGMTFEWVRRGRILMLQGRTDKAQVPKFMMEYLRKKFTLSKFEKAFPDYGDHDVMILYGEGYGAKIQKGGNYRPNDVSFRLFDVWVTGNNKLGGWWLEPENMEAIAIKLGVETVPFLGILTMKQVIELVKSKPKSWVAFQDGGNKDYMMEGVVARTSPLMLKRNGKRVIFKLKQTDFKRESEG